MKKTFWAVFLFLLSASSSANSLTEGLIVIDGYLKPAAISSDRKDVNITVEFAVRSDLLKNEPLTIEWEMIGKPTLDLSNQPFRFGPYRIIVDSAAKLIDYPDKADFVSISANVNFNGLVSEKQLPDDRYMVEFRATLLRSTNRTHKLATAEMPGQILAVLLNAGSKNERIIRARSLFKSSLDVTSSDNTFVVHSVETDSVGYTHARYEQYYKGVKVFGAQRIDHVDDVKGTVNSVTDGGRYDINVDTVPQITLDRALSIADLDMNPKGPYEQARTGELVIYTAAKVHRLSYHIHSEVTSQISCKKKDRCMFLWSPVNG